MGLLRKQRGRRELISFGLLEGLWNLGGLMFLVPEGIEVFVEGVELKVGVRIFTGIFKEGAK
jgi:hypothetical protein